MHDVVYRSTPMCISWPNDDRGRAAGSHIEAALRFAQRLGAPPTKLISLNRPFMLAQDAWYAIEELRVHVGNELRIAQRGRIEQAPAISRRLAPPGVRCGAVDRAIAYLQRVIDSEAKCPQSIKALAELVGCDPTSLRRSARFLTKWRDTACFRQIDRGDQLDAFVQSKLCDPRTPPGRK